MLSYVIRRLGQSFLVVAAALVLVFFVSHMIGDPVDMVLPDDAPDHVREALRHDLGLDRPLFAQFIDFVGRVFTGFGKSFWMKQPALEIALSRLGPTLYLTFTAIAIAVPIALLVGTLAALYPGTVLDRVITIFSLGGISTVDFWFGLMLILVFAVHLGVLPTAGYGGLEYVLLPACTLAYRSIGRIGQIARSAMLEEYGKPYIQVARAKGMPEWRVFLHASKNAAIPVLTIAGDEVANMTNGSLAVEVIFAWPGLGRLFIQGIEQRDLYLVEAAVFVIAVAAITVNLLVDLVYAWIDPKIRYS